MTKNTVLFGHPLLMLLIGELATLGYTKVLATRHSCGMGALLGSSAVLESREIG